MSELLELHPKTAIVIKQWLLEKMLESLNDESLPEDFKKFVREQGIDDEKVAKMLQGSPRGLFDVFDGHKVLIHINVSDNVSYPLFGWEIIGGRKSETNYILRKEAETDAIIEAFKQLEEKL